jgi:hypothetical protein
MTPRIDFTAAGSWHEMGLAQGAAVGNRIVAARAMLADLEAFRVMKPRWLPYPLFLRTAERKARAALEEAFVRVLPKQAERLRGMSEASGVRLETLYLLNGLEAFMCSLAGRLSLVDAPLAGAAVASACSAIAVRGNRSTTGEPIVARNFDYLPVVRPFYCLRESRPEGGFRSLEFTAAPLAGTVDGINERGLSITYNYAYAMDQAPAAPTISMAISTALAQCATVAEAAETITATERSGAGLLMLADAAGDLASLELSSSQWQLRREAGDLLCHSNAYNTPAMKQVEAPASAHYRTGVPAALRGRRVLESADRRDERLGHLLQQCEQFDGDSLAEVLADHGDDGAGSDSTLCMHSDYWNTTACVQLFPKTRRMRIAYDSACQAQFAEFSL